MFSECIEDEKQYIISSAFYFDHKRSISAFPHPSNKQQCYSFLDMHKNISIKQEEK